ncbi:MAG TPA: SDR family oxidoreductase [Nonomuraea sp.]|nr:SDR family oxidoreductase [Nonomuraea sp.]
MPCGRRSTRTATPPLPPSCSRTATRAVAAHGAEGVCADLDAGAATRAAKGIVKDVRGTAYSRQVDVAYIDQIEDFSQNIIAQHGVPDIVVNNAGVIVAGVPFLTIRSKSGDLRST